MKVCVLDFETSISKGIHKGLAKEPSNDFYTIIWGISPNEVKVMHNPEGFQRDLPKEVRDDLFSSDIIIGHNLPFDLSYIIHDKDFHRWVLNGGILWDTQIGEYLITGQRHTFSSLAELQQKYLGMKIKDDRISKLYNKGIGADKIVKLKETHKRLFKIYHEYSKNDGVTTLKVFLGQYKKAQQLQMLPIIRIYNGYMFALVLTMSTGILVDLENTEKTLRAFKLKSNALLEEASHVIKDYWSDERLPPFNILSPAHKSALLFGGYIKCRVRKLIGKFKDGRDKYRYEDELVNVQGFNLDLSHTSKSKINGRFVTDANVILSIAENSENEVAKKYCKLQKQAMNFKKMCSTYLEPFLKYSIDGLLFPQFNNTSTATGRLSSSQPNLQNVPSKGEISKYIQGQLIAPDGWICCSIDFSQLEIYIVAWLSGDKKLTTDLLSGIDFHVKRLAYAEDMTYEEVYKLCKIDQLSEWDLKRTKAKTISYQKAYGASPKSLAKSTGVPEDVIKLIFEKEDIEYPDVARFNKNVEETVYNHQELALAIDLPKSRKGITKNGRRFMAGVEVLPIVSDNGDYVYNPEETRNIGYYREITGKRYAFEEYGRYDRNNKLKRNFSYTQIMNYEVQGSAADVVGAVSFELSKYVLRNQEKVKMVSQIHDSVWFYVKEDCKDRVITDLINIMEDVPSIFLKEMGLKIPFKFKVDAEIGENFSDMKPYKIVDIKN